MRLRGAFAVAALAIPLLCTAIALTGAASSLAVEAAPGVMTVAVAAETDERAALGSQELTSGSFECHYCRTLGEECTDNSQLGWGCSLPELGCSCQLCGGEIACATY